MPELPDITAYLSALDKRILGTTLTGVRRNSPFLLRTVAPLLSDAVGQRVVKLRRLGKRIAIGFENDIWFVLHLMIAGRLHWSEQKDAAIPHGKNGLAAFDFDNGTLTLTEAGTKKRAALHVVANEAALAEHDPGGLEPLVASLTAFTAALRRENHTLKRSLTDPTLFSGIGNTYSDEILHRAGLSPNAMSAKLADAETERLLLATRSVLAEWITRLCAEADAGFPGKVTAFRAEMTVHGRFGQPCPVCGTSIQRIRYADNETN
jgi:formamidopyrimidine-DNA glycosylase